MHEYDTALKTVLMRLTPGAIRLLTGCDGIVRWHNVELPEVRAPRVDLLGETQAGELVHIELQSSNDPEMGLRMMEYAMGIRRAFGRFPAQVLLYTGQEPMRMNARVAGPSFWFEYRLVDIGEIDGEPLLASSRVEDNVIAVLMRLADRRLALRRILERIAGSNPEDRGVAMTELGILAGLRDLGGVLEQETTAMPILNDIMDHDLLGPRIREGIELGREQGLEKGRLEGEREIVAFLIEQRFGPMPAWAKSKLESMAVSGIKAVSLRLITGAGNLEDLFA